MGDDGRAEAAGEVPARRPAGELEAEVLAVLQSAAEPCSAAEVLDRLGGRLAYSTVVTILSRLFGKGVLTRHKDGRSFRYQPVADQPGLTARRMARMLDADPDRETVLVRFVSQLSERDERLLRAMLSDDDPG